MDNNTDDQLLHNLRQLLAKYAPAIAQIVQENTYNNDDLKNAIGSYAALQGHSVPNTQQEFDNLIQTNLLLIVLQTSLARAWHNKHNNDGNGNNDLINNNYNLNIPTTINDQEPFQWQQLLLQIKQQIKHFDLFSNEKQIPILTQFIEKLPQTNQFAQAIIQLNIDQQLLHTNRDIVGRLFEALINPNQRHKQGQFFTPPLIIDIINAFCINNPNDQILDPACGAGAFLVRAYQQLKKLKQNQYSQYNQQDEQVEQNIHQQLIQQLNGTDIADSAVQWAKRNIAMRQPLDQNMPNIHCTDFFAMPTPPNHTTSLFSPKQQPTFNAIVGNPPYTRQEHINAFDQNSKTLIRQQMKENWGITPSNRTSIYAYFFYQAALHLKQQGFIGFVVPNAWLDTDYGQELKQWILQHFQIICIIESAIERFFIDADINTTIVIIKQQSDKKSRNLNPVRFIYLKQSLQKFQIHYQNAENIKNAFLQPTKTMQTPNFDICIQPQQQLDPNDKWSIYLKAPAVYWTIKQYANKNCLTLKNLAQVRFGIKTGCNDFFHLQRDMHMQTEVQAEAEAKVEIQTQATLNLQNGLGQNWTIETDALKLLLKSPTQMQFYATNDCNNKHFLLYTDHICQTQNWQQQYPYLNAYLQHGQTKNMGSCPPAQKETCKSRTQWHNIGNRKPAPILTAMSANTLHPFFYNQHQLLEDARLYGIVPNDKHQEKALFAVLNSSFVQLQIQLHARSNLGLGALDFKVYEAENIWIPNLNTANLQIAEELFPLWLEKPYQSIFNDYQIDPKNPQFDEQNVPILRLKTDDWVLQLIGIENQQTRHQIRTQLYIAIINLIEQRLKRAKNNADE